MKIKINQIISIITIGILFLSFFLSVNAKETQTTIYVDPQIKNVDPGENFTLDIICEPTQAIEGYEFDLIYDQTFLTHLHLQ